MTHILFLCTGNTCRSPMAKCLMEDLARKRNLPVTCDSAGLIALPGAPASPGAQRAMSARSLSLRGHHAKKIQELLIQKADIVLCMTPAHLREFILRYPTYREKAMTLSEPVHDPFGGSDSLYEQTAYQLEYLLDLWVKQNHSN